MFIKKQFAELTAIELYKILSLRVEVFVVEQNCPYQDIDNKDLNSTHIWLEENKKIISYIRVVDKEISYQETSIGRVAVVKSFRGKGLAKKIVLEGIKYIIQVMQEDKITIGAQVYLKNFYNNLGFKPISKIYDEDGIPHLDMQYTKKLN